MKHVLALSLLSSFAILLSFAVCAQQSVARGGKQGPKTTTKTKPGMGDLDGDGVADKEDLCPQLPGPASNKGCPVSAMSRRLTDGSTCPGITVGCPPEVGVGEDLTFTANVFGGSDKAKPAYIWSVNRGTITLGQGTQKLTVGTAGAAPSISATVSVGGYDPSCPSTATCVVPVVKALSVPKTSPCPLIRVICPPDVKAGEVAYFKAEVKGGNPNVVPKYNWSLAKGTIGIGKSTDASIGVSTKNQEGALTATVDVSGFDRNCPGTATGTVGIKATTAPVTPREPLPCPTVRVSCPDEVKAGDNAYFSAMIDGGDPKVNPMYKWYISNGSIKSGQGTPSVELATKGMTGSVTATVDVSGFDRSCLTSASCTIQITGAPTSGPSKMGGYVPQSVSKEDELRASLYLLTITGAIFSNDGSFYDIKGSERKPEGSSRIHDVKDLPDFPHKYQLIRTPKGEYASFEAKYNGPACYQLIAAIERGMPAAGQGHYSYSRVKDKESKGVYTWIIRFDQEAVGIFAFEPAKDEAMLVVLGRM